MHLFHVAKTCWNTKKLITGEAFDHIISKAVKFLINVQRSIYKDLQLAF